MAVLGAVLWMSLGSLVTAGLSNGDVFTQAQAERISQVVVGSSGTIATTFRTAARDGSNGQTPTLPAGTPPEVATAVPFISQVVDSSYSTATRRATLVGAGFVLVGWFATLAMGSARTRRDESGELAP